MPDRRRIMVVHGRNTAARKAMFTFLRALDLKPLEWEQAVLSAGGGSPHNLVAVRAAMQDAQAVVVLLTAEDRAGLLPQLAQAGDDTALRGQPRQNVTLEAGMAMGLDADKTILVELGPIRRASDFDGLNVIRIDNKPQTRHALKDRLEATGCEIGKGATDWMDSSSGGDFDAAIVNLGDDGLADSPAPAAAPAVAGPPAAAPVAPTAPTVPSPTTSAGVASAAAPGTAPASAQDSDQPGVSERVSAFLAERGDAGTPFAATELYRAAGLTLGRGARMLSELRARGRIEPAGDGRGWNAKAP